MNAPSVSPTSRLRPMNLGDILDAVFRIYRSNFLTFLGIVALLQVPMIALQLLMTLAFGQNFASDLTEITQRLPDFNPNRDSFNDLPLTNIALFYVGSVILTLIQSLIVQQLIQGALTNAVAQRYLGRATSIGGAYKGILNRLPSLLGAAVLLGLIGFGAVLLLGGMIFGVALMIGLASATGGRSSTAVGVILALFIIFVMVIAVVALALLLVRFSFFTQAIVVEGEGAVGSLRRSWQLVGGSYWRVLGITLLVALMISIIVGIPSGLAGGVIGVVFADPMKYFVIRQTLTTLVSYVAQIIVLPVQLIAYTLLYFDLRVRKEGYDLEVMAQQINAAPYEGTAPYNLQ